MTNKEIFEVVKYFQEIYTSINNEDEILFSSLSFFYKASPHYILHGSLVEKENNVFISWAKDKTFLLKLSDISDLRNCLKKNVVSLDFDDESFKLIYKDKEEKEKVFLCSKTDVHSYAETVSKIQRINKEISFEMELTESFVKDMEILEVYLKDSSITQERNSDKVIEIPTKRIISLLKGSAYFIRFSSKNDEGRRYVDISSKGEYVNMDQIFATI